MSTLVIFTHPIFCWEVTLGLLNKILFFLVPPHQIILYDNSGREVQYQVGPIYEGGNLTLICEVRGGKCSVPAPHI